MTIELALLNDLRELWRELNHWWMWLILAAVLLTELAAAAGWLPGGTVEAGG